MAADLYSLIDLRYLSPLAERGLDLQECTKRVKPYFQDNFNLTPTDSEEASLS